MSGQVFNLRRLANPPTDDAALEPAALPKRTAAYPVRPFCSPSNSSSLVKPSYCIAGGTAITNLG